MVCGNLKRGAEVSKRIMNTKEHRQSYFEGIDCPYLKIGGGEWVTTTESGQWFTCDAKWCPHSLVEVQEWYRKQKEIKLLEGDT